MSIHYFFSIRCNELKKRVGAKKHDYLDFAQIAELIKSKAHLTDKGLEKIKLIQSNMNRKRIKIKQE